MNTTAMDQPVVIDSPEYFADPHAFLRRLREERPVVRGRVSFSPGQDVYFLTRYADCAELLTDRRFGRVVEGAPELPLPKAIKLLATDNMIMKDDPEHKRLRRLVSRPFTPRAIAQLADRVEAITTRLLDGFAPGQRIDLKAEYALPVPVTVISEMVGVPEADRTVFNEGMRLIVEGMALYGFDEVVRRMDPLMTFVRDLIATRRADPGDDILSGLIQPADDGDALTDNELVAMVFLLVSAGYETTFNLISNSVVALLAHPGQLALLHERPELIEPAVEELLRFTGTIGGTKPTYAREDVEIQGVAIPRGTMVIPLLASANRDAAEFTDPDTLDITRHPNPHIAFAKGNHFCLGANLARMETRVALKNLVARFPAMELAVAPDELTYLPTAMFTRLNELPVVLN